MKPMPSQARLLELFVYKDNNLYWRKPRGRANISKPAGYVLASGYRRISVDQEDYYAHRLIYVYHHGDIDDQLQIDHIDHDRDNNSITNLRLVTCRDNHFNRSGVLGITFDSRSGFWYAKHDHKHLGSSKCPLLARLIYEDHLAA